MKLHIKKRYSSCIKFYNFLRSNKLAPLHVKLKVLKACVINSLLYNCETSGDWCPKDLDNIYYNLIKATLQVRSSTPNAFVLIETGFLPLKAIIYGRQLNLFKRFNDALNKQGIRERTNPNLFPSPFLNSHNTLVPIIIKFRLGTHYVPIETGRWTRTPREGRLCQLCKVVVDERHLIYDCCLITRNEMNIPNILSDIWEHEDIYKLFFKFKETEYL